jgi:hypothetical protein
MKLLKFFLLCALTMSADSMLRAQMTDGKTLFGLKLGVNGTNLYDDSQAQDKKSRIGFTGGAFAKIPLGGQRFSLRPELLFTTKGAEFDIAGGITREIKLSYVELPLSLEMNLAILNLHAGLHAGLLADSEGKFKDAQGNPITTSKLDKDDLETLDYGWHAGAGLDLGNIGLHLRIARGLKDVEKSGTVQDLLFDLKNSAWTLTGSFAF